MRPEVKNYRILGRYRRLKRYFQISKEIRALNVEEALEKFFSEIGSWGLKRTQIEIIKIEEISPEEMKNQKLKKIAIAENPALWVM